MFGLLKKKKPYEQEAKHIYAQALQTVREPKFYTHFAVEDTMDARFDLLCLHLSLIMQRTLATQHPDAQMLNQALFDVLFIDMEQTLREIGIGDTGIKKRMKKMMTGFNGRLHSYAQATTAKAMTEALARNIYTAPTPPPEAKKLAAYVKTQQKTLAQMTFNDILESNSLFPD